MTNKERKQYVEDWKNSGKSKANFCRQQGLNYATFRRWTKRFGDHNDLSENNSNLVRLEIPSSIPSWDSSNNTIIGKIPDSAYGSNDWNKTDSQKRLPLWKSSDSPNPAKSGPRKT